MLIILFSTSLTSLLKSWRIFVPPICPAKNVRFIIEYLNRFVFKTVSFCVVGEVRCERAMF